MTFQRYLSMLLARLVLVAAVGTTALAAGESASDAPVRSIEILSPVYTIDREYLSMMGPSSVQQIRLPEADTPELIWITAYRTEMVGADGETGMPAEFMCHSNLDFDSQRHSRLLKLPVYHRDRLFTLSQGQLEVDLPPGFGLPFYSDETFTLTTQVLNLNPDGLSHRVRHKVTLEYVRDRDLRRPMKPLFMTSGWGMVLLEGKDGHYGVDRPAAEHGPGCLPGEPAAEDLREDAFGRKFSGHWVVPPGRQVNRTLVTHLLNLPYDTTIHYIAVHLHPFAESLELVDRTTGTSVFKSRVHGPEDRIGIDRVEHFADEKGIAVFADHEYELVSVYDNTTPRDVDSMAVMLLYLLDKRFEKPKPIELSSK